MADKRVEKTHKSLSLLQKNQNYYRQMLTPILRSFTENGMIRLVREEGDVYEKIMALSKIEVEEWLKESASHAFWVNFAQNIWTIGPVNGILYGLAKVKRSKM